MSEERLLSKPYEIEGAEYELWYYPFGGWFLIRDGEEADMSKFNRQQLDQIAQDVVELRMPQ